MKKPVKFTAFEKKVHKYIEQFAPVGAEEIRAFIVSKPYDMGKALKKLRDGNYIRARGVTRAVVYNVTQKALV